MFEALIVIYWLVACVVELVIMVVWFAGVVVFGLCALIVNGVRWAVSPRYRESVRYRRKARAARVRKEHDSEEGTDQSTCCPRDGGHHHCAA